MDLNDAEIDRLFDEAKAGGGDISRKKKLLEKQKKARCGCGGPSGDQRSIWQCAHSAGVCAAALAKG
jgi:hypothetical protein